MNGTDVFHLVYVLEHFEDVQSQSLSLQKHFQNKNTFIFLLLFA